MQGATSGNSAVGSMANMSAWLLEGACGVDPCARDHSSTANGAALESCSEYEAS